MIINYLQLDNREDRTTITRMRILHYFMHNYTFNALFILPICTLNLVSLVGIVTKRCDCGQQFEVRQIRSQDARPLVYGRGVRGNRCRGVVQCVGVLRRLRLKSACAWQSPGTTVTEEPTSKERHWRYANTKFTGLLKCRQYSLDVIVQCHSRSSMSMPIWKVIQFSISD